MLARRAAAREERLQRLRGELDDLLAVDATDPPPLHRVVERDGTCTAALRLRAPYARRRRRSPGRPGGSAPRPHSRDRVRPRATRRLPSPSVRKATIPSSVRTNRSSRGFAPVSSRTTRLDRSRRRRDLLPRGGLFQRLEVRLHGSRPRGTAAQDRLLDLLGDRVRAVERQIARKLQVQGDLEAPVHLEDGEVVDLPDLRRPSARPRARAPAVRPRPRCGST